ncbi:MAG: fasciclin domain-containing protein [Bacteroidaceae bacterium]|nr:fasciclin domain-containing protein [Bacteroidaceae bacterium]
MLRKHLNQLLQCSAMAMTVLSTLAACTEEIDKSARYTFTEETVLSYLEKQERFSDYVRMLGEVNISNQSESTVEQLLSARGHFTVFPPSNEAIQLYLDTLQRKGIITTASWDGFPNEKTKDSIQKVIVYNSIIDGGDDRYFETANFPTSDNDEFPLPNMNDRKLSVTRSKINPDSIFINGEYPLSMECRDVEAINGRIHEVTEVIAPSNDTMADLLKQWAEEGHQCFTVAAKLILACGLEDTLRAVRDETWEYLYQTGQVKDIKDLETEGSGTGKIPEHRKYGFTIFAETDGFWERTLNKPVSEITVEDVRDYITGLNLIEGKDDENYKDEKNILNQFVTYHILPERLTRDKLVIHYNELGYNYASSKTYTVATEEFYTTMGKRRLIKLYESLESKGIYINRFPVLRNGRGEFAPEKLNINDYHETTPSTFLPLRGTYTRDTENEGIPVGANDSVNVTENVLNAMVYPIDQLLIYTDNVATQLKNQRIRMDLASCLPEMMNNDHRGRRTAYPTGHARNRGFPTNYNYFENIDIKEGTRFFYLNGLACNWLNWQGDEFNIVGIYEFTIKLPPVPKAGHYELRLAIQSNSSWRGMCQVYWGENKDYLPAAGIPLDMRLAGTYRNISGTQIADNTVGWVADTGDPEVDDETDKKMRNNGFMKGPNHYSATPGSSDAMRNNQLKLRRIMVSEDMDPDKTYYVKFKSVLESDTRQFYIDYIEYCAKEVYDNPEVGEDIW